MITRVIDESIMYQYPSVEEGVSESGSRIVIDKDSVTCMVK